MWCSQGIGEHETFWLVSLLLHRWITVEQQCQFPFLEGCALDGLVSFAGDGIAQVVPDWSNTPDIACW